MTSSDAATTGARAPFMPVERMWRRVETGKAESDTTCFYDLMFFGEMLTKTIVAAVVAGIDDDCDRARYRHVHSLVRANGVGDWASTLEEAVTGPAAQHFSAEMQDAVRELTQKLGPGSWQFDAARLLVDALGVLDPDTPTGQGKVDGKRWLTLFARLRNKTRGHGALTTAVCSKLCVPLEQSLRLVSQGLGILRGEWAYLHRNLSGKYRVTILGGTGVPFARLKATAEQNIRNGVYLHLERPRIVELVDSDVDASDFFLANGGFTGQAYELLSYITGATQTRDASAYLDAVGPLPGSETQGNSDLEVLGEVWTNLPARPDSHIVRPALEQELVATLAGDRYPVVTLVGRGGIGKTSLALSALHSLATQSCFDLILWFSARDLDLLMEGPKRVRPAVVSMRDMARAFVQLVNPPEAREKEFRPEEYLARALTKSPFGPTLFVFDNFETVTSPGELYRALDTHIRLPNKILVTTRQREFRGDYPIDVKGMEEPEFRQLVAATATRLRIEDLLTDAYRDDLFRESEGHPYVAKILLGEVARAGQLRDVRRIVADKADILTALFERTFASLSPSAQRVFLTLSSWRSTIPKLAIEAVLLRRENEAIRVGEAIEELERSSFIELTASEGDGQLFVTTPLAAFLYGKRKLAVSPMKAVVEADLELLREFGPGQREDVRRGLEPRIARLIGSIARRVEDGKEPLSRYVEMIQFIARDYGRAWLMLASLQEESTDAGGLKAAAESVRQFLAEARDEADRVDAWRRVASLCHRADDVLGEIQALAELAVSPGAGLEDISLAANRLNQLLSEKRYALETDEKRIVVRKVEGALRAHLKDADADDLSRLAWLELRLGDERLAFEYVKKGLELEPSNEHCLGLSVKLAPRFGAIPPKPG